MKRIFLVGLVFLVFFLWQNNHIVVSDHIYKSTRIPEEFDGFKILHISDLHNKSFGRDQKYLLKKIEEAEADIILITGDLIDRRRFDLKPALEFIEGAKRLAPIYYVPGNHEAWSGKYEDIRKELVDQGVEVLDDRKLELKRKGKQIEILGLRDPGFYEESFFYDMGIREISDRLMDLNDSNKFKILLSHRPELVDLYSQEDIDMIFSGHAHGGQFRLPGLGGLVAPDQGFFPKYTSGSHKIDNSTLYVSRGLGNSIIPIRIFNRPEIIVVTLERD